MLGDIKNFIKELVMRLFSRIFLVFVLSSYGSLYCMFARATKYALGIATLSALTAQAERMRLANNIRELNKKIESIPGSEWKPKNDGLNGMRSNKTENSQAMFDYFERRELEESIEKRNRLQKRLAMLTPTQLLKSK